MKKKRMGDSKVDAVSQDRILFKKLAHDHNIRIVETAFYTQFINPSNHRSVMFDPSLGQKYKYKIAKLQQIL